MLSAAAILRRLLLDERRLVDRVNRDRRLKLTYRINVRPPIWQVTGDPSPITWSREDGLDPETAHGVPQPQDVTLDRLLATLVVVHNGYEVSVKELIQHAAHVKGGVHLGEPKSDKDRALSELASSLSIGGYSAGTGPMKAIGRVVLKGLQPLRALIEEESSPAPPGA